MMERMEELGRAAGLDLGPGTRWSIASLNDLDPGTVERIRALDRGEQQLALRHLVRPESHGWLDAFLDAIESGVDSAEWGKGGVLVPALGFRDLVARTAPDIVSLLGLDAEPERAVVVEPSLEAWAGGTDVTGAPGRRLGDDVDYRWSAPAGTIRMLSPHPPVAPTDDPELAVLRWVASRIAFVTGKLPGAMSEADPSADARRAASVLEREEEDGTVPGFRAPADWYRSS